MSVVDDWLMVSFYDNVVFFSFLFWLIVFNPYKDSHDASVVALTTTSTTRARNKFLAVE